jgi:hypothetical protein
VSDEEFFDLLDRLGGDMEHWPASLRLMAEARLAISRPARAGLAAMRRTEALLATAAMVPAFDSGALAARASAIPQQRPLVRRLSWAAAGTVAVVMGLLVGMTPQNDVSVIGSVQTALNPGADDAL